MGLIDQYLKGEVRKQQNLTAVLGAKGENHRVVIENMVHDLFKITPQQLKEMVLMGNDAPPGQNYMLPKILELDKIWKETRDEDWLYGQEIYWLETLACAWLYTTKSIVDPAISFLLQEKPKLEHVLDWGAGSGLSTMLLAANFPDTTFYYYEISPTSIDMFKWLHNYLGLENVVHVEELPDVEFDAIFYVEVINHIRIPMPAIDPALKQLRIGGLVAQQTSWTFEKKYGESVGHFLEYDIDDHYTDNVSKCSRIFDKAMLNRNLMRIRSGAMQNRPIWYVRTAPHPEVLPSLKQSFEPAVILKFIGRTCSMCRTPGHSRKACPDSRLYPENHISKPWEIQLPPISERNPEETYQRSFGDIWTEDQIRNYIPSNVPLKRKHPTSVRIAPGPYEIKSSKVEIHRLLQLIDTTHIPDEFTGRLEMNAGGFHILINAKEANPIEYDVSTEQE